MTDNTDVLDTQSTNDQQQAADDLIATLVGDGKKFKTVNDLAKGKVTADAHIAQIEKENQDLRNALKDLEAKANQQTTLSELVEALKAKGSTDGNPGSLDVEQLTSIVRNVTQEDKLNERKQANRAKVNAELLKIAGGDVDKAKQMLAARASELGLDLDTVRTLSEKSPSAVLSILNFKSTNNDPNPVVKPNVNSQAVFTNDTGDAKTNSYYSELRRKMGVAKFYGDYKLVQKMYADAEKLGDKFYQ